ncbi:MAG: hypothetical protein GF334_12695 [Candidatus Altiarchaeales archaeon]|nr:hypothetical protein [Candidatus Altiarchaeales archaeon]
MRKETTHILSLISLILLVTSPILFNPRFDPDDYRYIHKIQGFLAQEKGLTEILTIKNSWRHLWWYPEYEVVFFRASVNLTYLLDYLLWGLNPLGYALTNLILYIVLTIFVYLFFQKIFSRENAYYAAIIYAIHPVHGENLWYLAGRTDTLASIFLLASLLAFIRRGENKHMLPLSLGFYLLALASKEYCIVLPAIILLWMLIFECKTLRQKINSLLPYLLVSALYYLIRIFFVGEAFTNQLIYPYFFTPNMPGFGIHIIVMILMYAFNLLLGLHTPPFYVEDLRFLSLLGGEYLFHLASVLVFLSSVALIFHKKNTRFFSGFMLLTWIPASITYLSERFLTLPSVAYIGLLILSLDWFQSKINLRRIKAGVIVFLIIYYGVFSLAEYIVFSQPREYEKRIKALDEKLVFIGFEKGYVYLLNYPFVYVESVFLKDIVKARYGQGITPVILTMQPPSNGGFTLEGDNTAFFVSGETPLFGVNPAGFRSRELVEGGTHVQPSFNVTLLNVSGEGVSAMKFDLRGNPRLVLAWSPQEGEFKKIFP